MAGAGISASPSGIGEGETCLPVTVRAPARMGISHTDVALSEAMAAPVFETQARLHELELQGRAKFKPEAAWLAHRRGMVDWICEACEACGLERTTGHVACQYLDRVCNQDDVPTHRLALVSLAAIQIAAKYEEKEESVPPLEVLIARSGHPIPEKQVHQMEVLMLTSMDWICTAVVPMHFLGLYAARGVVFADDATPSSQARLKGLGRYLDFFADLCCQDYEFERFRPSSVAGGVVLAARRALGLRDVWTPRLAEVMHAPVCEMAVVFFRVWSNYVAQFGQAAADIDRRYAAAAADSSVEWLSNIAIPEHILAIPEARRAPRHIWERRKLGAHAAAAQAYPSPPSMAASAGPAAATPAAAPSSAHTGTGMRTRAAALAPSATAVTVTAKRSHSATGMAEARAGDAAAVAAPEAGRRERLAESTGSQQANKRWSGPAAPGASVPALGVGPTTR